MSAKIAVKRISAVEVDPERSHQHEFHAGRLRRELGFGDDRTTGPLVTLIFESDDSTPVVDESGFTLYDARERVPTRAAEWHLYYTSSAIADHARQGDLALLYRRGPALHAVIARRGTSIERDLLEAIAIGPEAVREQFAFVDIPLPDEDEGRAIARQMTLPAGTAAEYAVSDHPIFATAHTHGRMPTTRQMATASMEILGAQRRDVRDPDEFLTQVLEIETDLYYAIEADIYSDGVASLMSSRPSVIDIIDFAMSIQQGRRSRRGTSLQNHFARLLDREAIPYSAQCTTEPSEVPDFVVPDCGAYHDHDFPRESLRMVACKSTAKERWRQILNEAARIPTKYLLTLDPGLTATTLDAMANAGIQVFLPVAIVRSAYAGHTAAQRPRSVSDLIAELAAVSR